MSTDNDGFERVAVKVISPEEKDKALMLSTAKLWSIEYLLLYEGDGGVIAPAFKQHLLDIIGHEPAIQHTAPEVAQ